MRDIKEKEQIIIDYLYWLFRKIKWDWSDPRFECKQGIEAIHRLEELRGKKLDKDIKYFDSKNTLDEWLEMITDDMKEDYEND